MSIFKNIKNKLVDYLIIYKDWMKSKKQKLYSYGLKGIIAWWALIGLWFGIKFILCTCFGICIIF